MVFVQTLTSGLLDLQASPDTTVGTLKSKIEELGIAPSSIQKLYSNGKEVFTESTLKDHSLSNDSVLSLVLDLEGGAKKRKKKTYTTPKKIKHKRKKVKLAILKLFSTEGDRVRALRRTCPYENRKDSQATFMAVHKNSRYYCGHCYTIVNMNTTPAGEATAA